MPMKQRELVKVSFPKNQTDSKSERSVFHVKVKHACDRNILQKNQAERLIWIMIVTNFSLKPLNPSTVT